jgi:hypothetical protein
MYNRGDVYRSDDGLDYGYIIIHDLSGNYVKAKQYLGKHIRNEVVQVSKDLLARRFNKVENDTTRF